MERSFSVELELDCATRPDLGYRLRIKDANTLETLLDLNKNPVTGLPLTYKAAIGIAQIFPEFQDADWSRYPK